MSGALFTRAKVLEQLTGIEDGLGPMVEAHATRRISFDEEV